MTVEIADLVISGGLVVAFDGEQHRYLEAGSIAIAGDRILAVGKDFTGAARRRIDARGLIAIPGQISTHAHIGAHEGPRLLVDGGRREFVRSSFLHFLPQNRVGRPGFLAPQDARASLRYGFASLLRHGVTTVVAFAPAGPRDGEMMLETAREFGIRLVWSPVVTGGRYWLEEDGRVSSELDTKAGFQSLEATARFIERLPKTADARVSGLVALDEYYLSTPELRKQAKKVANALGVPFTLHFVEQHREFYETMGQTGLTPVQCLAQEGVLDAGTILAHCVYISTHSAIGYPVEDDIAILGAAGVNVAHSPVAFARRGIALESFDRFRRAGVNVALATDTYPLDMFAEMRMASLMNKLADGNFEAGAAADVFRASNLAGASALGRPDLGRLQPGAKADVVLVDPRSLSFGANPDPIRALVHLAGPDRVSSVIVDGKVLVEDGRLLVADEAEILAEVAASSRAVWDAHPSHDILGRTVSERFPPSLPLWAE
jgi:cytosine/adenosine deaminase-related metal-dependent hydrolase